MAHATTASVVVKGYGSAGDGGGGIFLWNDASTLADNDGTIIRPNDVAAASPGRWIRLYSGPVNVRWFGAGLGLGSDLARIMSALVILTATGGELFFPAGNYCRSGGRVARYAHNVQRMMNVPQQAAALLAVLMLRGPQTAGELRINCERLHRFADISGVEALLNQLAERPEGALVAELPRQPGSRENRWMHRLAREPLDASSLGSATGAVILRGRFIG
jgi:hypothetical protein